MFAATLVILCGIFPVLFIPVETGAALTRKGRLPLKLYRLNWINQAVYACEPLLDLDYFKVARKS